MKWHTGKAIRYTGKLQQNFISHHFDILVNTDAKVPFLIEYFKFIIYSFYKPNNCKDMIPWFLEKFISRPESANIRFCWEQYKIINDESGTNIWFALKI